MQTMTIKIMHDKCVYAPLNRYIASKKFIYQ